MTATKTRTRKPATIADLITAEFNPDIWAESSEQLEATPEQLPKSSEQLSHTPAFLFLMAAVAVLVVGKAMIACAVLAFNLGRKAVNYAIDARTPKINFGVYRSIFEGLEA